MTALWIGVGIGVTLLVVWFFWTRTERVDCTLDLERTHEHFHAHVELLAEIFPEAGDAMYVESAPVTLEYGETRTVESTAVVRRASSLRRWWTRFIGRFEFYELYDVGFE